MKKILVSLLVLALCAPAMAATVTITDNEDGTATITVAKEGADNIVGLALNIDVTGGNVTDANVATATFDIFPDAAYTLESTTPGSYGYGDGTPIADQDAAGEVGISNSFAISVGALNGEFVAGANGAASVDILVTVDADANICVEENAIRGGIVLTTGAGEDITNGTAGVVCGDVTVGSEPECVKSTAPFYSDWVLAGSPDCWCYRKHCRGDADGQNQSSKQGSWAVGTNDLDILVAAWQVFGTPDQLGEPGICADFAKDAQSSKQGSWRVGTNDLDLLILSWQVFDPGVADCPADDFNFWTN